MFFFCYFFFFNLNFTKTFHRVVTLGRILNRFSKDIGAIDELLPKPMIEVIQISLVTLGIIIMEIIVNYWTIIPLIILAIFTYLIKLVYIATVQSIKRYEGICKYRIFLSLVFLLYLEKKKRKQREKETSSQFFSFHTS